MAYENKLNCKTYKSFLLLYELHKVITLPQSIMNVLHNIGIKIQYINRFKEPFRNLNSINKCYKT